MTEVPVQTWGLFDRAAAPTYPTAPAPDEEWRLPGGTAWVYYGADHPHLVRPVILADGFSAGRSDLNELWDGLENHDFAFNSGLLQQGNDLIILGYDDRTASITSNARAATECILKAIAERVGDAPMVVGGFSMGGLVTRYALAKLEFEHIDHQTAIYVSYDSPHRGAWIPICLQALAHFLRAAAPAMAQQINSPAARQLLWRHIDSVGAEPAEDPLRTEFLAELDRVGSWPMRPLKLGVANGTGDGAGTGVPAGVPALTCLNGVFATTQLATQASADDFLVARLKSILIARAKEVRTSGLPAIDGAPGGTLETFGIAADNLAKFGKTQCDQRVINFVPSVSAVAIRDIDTDENLYADIGQLPPGESELDDFRCSTVNTAHTLMTEELGTWLLDRIPQK
jgi:hypothetical protein